ncbi:MAG: NADAR family protein [Clostridiales bacterium]|nr:NADAR family protein [Clostridiales bacterium]
MTQDISGNMLSGDDRDFFIARQILRREYKGFYMLKMYVLDNFSAFQIEADGKIYPTAEHLYQASKFFQTSDAVAERIRTSRSPHEAKLIAHIPENERLVREDWDEVKYSVMRRICTLKTRQHPYVRDKLIESGDVPLAEFSESDSYWGIGADGNGQNTLGKIRESIREEIKAELK